MAGRVHEAEVSNSKRLLYADATQPSNEIPAYFRGYFDSIPSSLLLAADLVPPEGRQRARRRLRTRQVWPPAEEPS